MAYTPQSSNESSLLPWIVGGAALFYLWYEGYLAAWLGGSTATTGAVDENGVADGVTSVTSGATTPTVTQTASTTTPTVSDLANESYYTWLASGAPLSTLEQIDAAAQVVENNYVAANSSPTSVASGSSTPSVSAASTPAMAQAAESSGWAYEPAIAAGLASLANGILTYTSGISYRINPDGTMTFLTPSTQVQRENAASTSSSNPTPSTSVASGGTPVRGNTPVRVTPGYRTSNTTPPTRMVSVHSANPTPATSVTSANPPRR